MKAIDSKKVPNPLDNIKRIEQKREERRVKMEDMKRQKEEKKAYNLASGKNVDIDFEIMIDKNRFTDKMLSPHTSSVQTKLSVCVRKRPIFKKEEQAGEIDSISSANPQIRIHEPKFRVDGITKYVENHTFTFDNTFNQDEDSTDIYKYSIKPLIPLLIGNGIVTCFAYGQTGSGKTFTMNQMQVLLVNQLFDITKGTCEVAVSFFEIYAGRCLDLLNQKNVLNILEDKSGSIQINGLVQRSATSAKDLLQTMENANSVRTTHSTVANDTSSRSHAICQVLVRKNGSDIGKLVLVDLAGSERAQDTQSNNRQRRMEGAEINKSLLALKECIRAMDEKADHVPFRASKLTLILRDSFVSKMEKSKVVMIACISPGSSSADHSLNTLRYADRLKDNSQIQKIFNEMHENKSGSNDVQNEFSKDHVQKIESLKNIRREENKSRDHKDNSIRQNKDSSLKAKERESSLKPQAKAQIKDVKQEAKEGKQEKYSPKQTKEVKEIKGKAPSIPLGNNGVKPRQPKEEVKKEEEKKAVKPSAVQKKPAQWSKSERAVEKKANEKENESLIEEQIEEEERAKEEKASEQKRRAREDVNIMKSTMQNNAVGDEYFAFQEKVSNILEEQEQVFKTHMTAIKEDAKLLTQESELISKVQGVGYQDFDIDSYVEKLQAVVKRKLKIYSLLSKKIENFKKCLSEEEQIRHNVKDTFYF